MSSVIVRLEKIVAILCNAYIGDSKGSLPGEGVGGGGLKG